MGNWYSGDSQIAWACRAFLKGTEISHMDEILNVRGWRLAAIVWELKTRYGWQFDVRYGVDNIAYYRLKRCLDKASLKMPRSYLKSEKGALTPSSKSE